MRATVVQFDSSTQTCQLRLVDTGVCDSTQYGLDSILPWPRSSTHVNDFNNFDQHLNADLLALGSRAIRCVLVKNDQSSDNQQIGSEYERDIEQETRFLFRDLTATTAVKCLLVRQIDLNNNNNPPPPTDDDSTTAKNNDDNDHVWAVKLYRYIYFY